MRRILLGTLLIVTFSNAVSQSKIRKLPATINHPSLDLFAPYISFDGNALLFISNSGQDGALTLSYTARENDWSEPTEVPKTINTRLNFLKGYALSADGKRMYFTSAKSPVIGGYDIFTSELKGSSWSTPENMMLPINSKSNDACPSISADGSAFYFMRCDKMDQNNANGCKIFATKKKSNGQWEEPVELPSHINTGNSQAPRIMADGETLIFSSDKFSGKGGMDLYLTKLNNGVWSEPVALDFVNTEKDDQYISVAALGRYLLKEVPGARKNYELTEFLIPDDLRPKGMMKIEGKVTDEAGAVVPAYISIIDLKINKRIYSGRPAADGSYFLYLQEGSHYEMVVDPEQSNVTFYSKTFDLTSEKIPQKEKLNVTIQLPKPGDEIGLNMVKFKSYSSLLEPSAEAELKRFARVAKANPHLKFEIQVLLNGYEENIEKVNPDLTEIIVDSVQTQIELPDSLGELHMQDTMMVRTTYHNDRTIQQAEAIISYLVSQGVNADNLSYFRNAIPATLPENKKITIKAVARTK